MDAIETVPLEEMLENNTWMRNLARGLLFDKSQTEDVLQEVWVAALRSPPRKRQAVRAWLSKVVRSVAFRANRRLSQRDDVERTHHTSNGDKDADRDTPDRITRRIETQKILMDAVLSLKVPYRTVVYQRYFENLELDEIAKRSSVPSSTIRTQLSRGLDQLREGLTRHFGGGRAWGALLLPLLAAEDLAAIAGGATVSGVVPGGTATSGGPGAAAAHHALRTRWALPARWIVPVVVATTILVGTSYWTRSSTTGSDELAWLTSVSGVDADKIDFSNNDTESVVEPRAVSRNEAPAALRAKAFSRIRVVEATTGAPIAGASVSFYQLTQAERIPAGHTSDEGLVSVPAALLQRDKIVVRADGFVTHTESYAARDARYGPYVVELDGEFTATVDVTLDGDPAARVPVTIRTSREDRELVTDADGRVEYVYRDVGTSVVVEHESYVTVTVVARTPTTSIALRGGTRVRGQAIVEDGEPLANAPVRIQSESLSAALETTTDAAGYFAAGVLDLAQEVTLTFALDDEASYRVRGKPPESGEWRIEIPSGDLLVGRVIGPLGDAVSGGVAFLMTPEGEPKDEREGVVTSREVVPLSTRDRGPRRLTTVLRASLDVDGRFQIGPVDASARPLYLWIFHRGFVNHLLRLSPETIAKPRTIHLRKGREVAGRLVGPTGDPIVGALLHLGEIWTREDEPDGIESIVGHCRTSVDGAFRFVGVPGAARETLAGSLEGRGDRDEKQTLFLAAFAPDELLSLDGLALVDSPIRKGFVVRPGGAALHVVGASQANGIALNVRLRDENGTSVSAWCPALVIDTKGGVHRGCIGKRSDGQRFYSDHELASGSVDGARLLVMRDGYLWREVEIAVGEKQAFVEVSLTPRLAARRVLRVRDSDGSALVGEQILVGLPLGAARSADWLPLGTTDPRGSLDVGCLPAGNHHFAAAGAAGRRDLGWHRFGESGAVSVDLVVAVRR